MFLPHFRLRTKFEKTLFLVGIVLVVFIVHHVFHSHLDVYKFLPLASHGRVIFPANQPLDKSALWNHLKHTSSNHWRLVQVKPDDTVSVPDFVGQDYHKHSPFSLYHYSANVEENQCDALQNVGVNDIFVTSQRAIHVDLRRVLQRFVDLKSHKDSYYEDVAPLMIKHVRAELARDYILPFWFRLSGSSVWLKDYNVHFMISRFIFADNLNKDDPRLSLMFAQIFDENWEELENVRLVFPTNDIEDKSAPVFKLGGKTFSLYQFPLFLPIPFYHDYGKGGKLFGLEDPRIMLVRNAKGYEEPLITFNAKHKAVEKNPEGDKVDKEYRSMFYSLPFQLQKGKGNLEGGDKLQATDAWFARTKEIRVVGDARQAITKNWTPMLTRYASVGYDKYVLFATQLDNLRIVQCDLYSSSEECYPVYSMGGNHGDLRGGTPFININSLLQEQHPDVVKRVLPQGREVYIGIAHAKLSLCGCANFFYRPNLVVIIKDRASFFDSLHNEDHTQYFYKVSHVSSSLSLEVDINPWIPEDPKSVCENVNVNALIPNGIDAWKIYQFKNVGDAWDVEDTLSLSISVSDNSVYMLNIKGVLRAVVNSYDTTAFLNAKDTPNQFLGLPSLNDKGYLQAELPGSSNDNIRCALDMSRKYCKQYGDKQREIAKNMELVSNAKTKKKSEDDMRKFKKILEG